MKLIKCPEVLGTHKPSTMVFLAGGITGCPNWQAEITELLKFHDLTLVNPRRDKFDIHDHTLLNDQIDWEHTHIGMADVVLFWFPEETICPITLYELGMMAGLHEGPKILVGCHPNYTRRFDIVKQMSLVQPDVEVVYSLSSLMEQL